jgi:tetratricopeptide (TPR) repeat protein
MPPLSRLLAVLLLAGPLASAQFPQDRSGATAHAGAAARLMQERRFEEAAGEYERSLALNPANDAIRIEYATCLFAQERDQDARAQFEMEIKRLGEQTGLSYYLAQLDIRAYKPEEAIRRLKPLTANPAFPKASFYLGVAYLSAGQQALALRALEQAARDNPADPEVHYRLGRVYMLADRTADGDREFDLFRQTEQTRRFVEETGHACMEALRTQPIERAQAVCDRIADAHDARRMLWLGELYASYGFYTEALGPFRTAAQLDPQSFDAWHNLGRSLYLLKRYGEAVPALKKAAALNPGYFDTLNLLAAALHASGNDAAALPVLERAHALNPADTAAAAALVQMRAARPAAPPQH